MYAIILKTAWRMDERHGIIWHPRAANENAGINRPAQPPVGIDGILSPPMEACPPGATSAEGA